MLEDREELVKLFDEGANIYVCGSTGVGAGIREACKQMYLEKRRAKHAELKEKGETPPGAELDEDLAASEARRGLLCPLNSGTFGPYTGCGVNNLMDWLFGPILIGVEAAKPLRFPS